MSVYARYLARDDWTESDHPRGQPGNAGQFGPGGAGGKKAAKKQAAKKPEPKPKTERVKRPPKDAVAPGKTETGIREYPSANELEFSDFVRDYPPAKHFTIKKTRKGWTVAPAFGMSFGGPYGTQEDAVEAINEKAAFIAAREERGSIRDAEGNLSWAPPARQARQDRADARRRKAAGIVEGRKPKPDPKTDTALQFLGKSGGLDQADIEDYETETGKRHRVGIIPVFRKKGSGMSIETAGEKLRDAGWDVTDRDGNVDGRKVRAIIHDEIAGRVHYSRARSQADLDRELEQQREYHEEAERDAERSIADWRSQSQHAKDFTMLLDRAKLVDPEGARIVMSEADDSLAAENALWEIANRGQQTQSDTDPWAREDFWQGLEDLPEESDREHSGYGPGQADIPEEWNRENPAPEVEPVLSSYSRADLTKRAAENEAAEKEEAHRKAAEERRAFADRERNNFTLTGSNRKADVLASGGQRGLFDAMPARRGQAADQAPRQTYPTQRVSTVNTRDRRALARGLAYDADTHLSTLRRALKAAIAEIDAAEKLGKEPSLPMLERHVSGATDSWRDYRRDRGRAEALDTRSWTDRNGMNSENVDEYTRHAGDSRPLDVLDIFGVTRDAE